MVRIHRLFDTREAAEAFVRAYLRDYHPCGYGTRLEIAADGSEWAVTGHRFSSCD